MTLTFYWYPKCGTCQKAKKWLEENKLAYNPVHIVENPPTKDQLEELISKSALPAKKFFNTSGRVYRELGLKDKLKEANQDQMLEWLASDGMLIKRPILTDGEKVTVGFKEEKYNQTWLEK